MGRVITNPTGSVVDASEVKILYESNENTNAYTDGDKASLGEVKDAIDMAKKVIEITFLLNDWTSNSDGTYSQTVNNSEIKSSMNPDLISMLSSGATPEEQKTYMKNFSILCQGVGNTANGSVTYKIYKQMTGDITVGLTRLGGVKQIESGAKVDDVKVGGVSVVKDKVAEIPAIPTNLDFVPYKNAQRDIELGDKILSAGISITEDGVTTGYNTSLHPQSISVGAGIKKSGELFPSDKKNVELTPDGMVFTGNTPNSSSITVTPEYSKDEDFDHLAFIVKNYKLQQGFAKLKVGEPTEDSQAATKKYVDESISAISEVDTSNLVPYSGATKDVNIGNHNLIVATATTEALSSRTEEYNLNANIGTGGLERPGVSIEAKQKWTSNSDYSTSTKETSVTIVPGNFTVLNRREISSGARTDKWMEASLDGLKVASYDNSILITDTSIKELADPVDGRDAANKKYVDESIAAIPEVDVSNLVPYTGATKDVDLNQHKIKAGDLLRLGTDSTNVYLSTNGITVNGTTTPFYFRLNADNNNFAFYGNNAEPISPIIGEPTADNQAATKKYVDDNIQRTYGYRKQLGLSDEIGSGKALTIAVELSRSSSKTGIAPDEILSFDVYANASATGMVSSIPTLDIEATTQYFTVNSKGIYTTTKWFVLTNNDPDEISYSANNAYVTIRTLYPDVTITIRKKALSS